MATDTVSFHPAGHVGRGKMGPLSQGFPPGHGAGHHGQILARQQHHLGHGTADRPARGRSRGRNPGRRATPCAGRERRTRTEKPRRRDGSSSASRASDDWSKPQQWVFARRGKRHRLPSSEWGTGIDPYRFNIDYDWNPEPETSAATIFTERGHLPGRRTGPYQRNHPETRERAMAASRRSGRRMRDPGPVPENRL